MARGPRAATAALLVVAGAAAGCATGSSASTPSASGRIIVAAAENIWGSIASQLGGNKVAVESIVTNPETDPHSYQPTAADGRTIATSQMVIYNGVGYDPWAPKLLAADSGSNPTILNVGRLVGVPDGGNPHRWYSPANVQSVIAAITADYKQVDPKDAAYFDTQNASFQTTSLATYNQLASEIKARYAGVAVGASESIFAPLAQALGLNLITPSSFLDAISEGTEPTAEDKATIESQIKTHQLQAYVYNSQNSTPDVQAQVNQAKAAGIQVTTITETLEPASSTFQAWQVRQLQSLSDALGKATGR